MDSLEKIEFTASIRHISIFLKSRIPIFNFEVPDMASRKMRRRKRRRRTQPISKRYVFHANAKSFQKRAKDNFYSCMEIV